MKGFYRGYVRSITVSSSLRFTQGVQIFPLRKRDDDLLPQAHDIDATNPVELSAGSNSGSYDIDQWNTEADAKC